MDGCGQFRASQLNQNSDPSKRPLNPLSRLHFFNLNKNNEEEHCCATTLQATFKFCGQARILSPSHELTDLKELSSPCLIIVVPSKVHIFY